MGKSDIIGVTTTKQAEIEINSHLDFYFAVYTLNNAILRRYIKRSPLVGVKVCFKLLIALRGYNKPTKYQIRTGFNMNQDCIDKASEHLLNEGLIVAVDRPRLIKPFGKYKKEQAYILTAKGHSLLVNIAEANKLRTIAQ